MSTTEQHWDKKLKIHTDGRDESRADQYRYPYEPTPYCVLERLAQSGYITRSSRLVDYGCGKGRVGIFLAVQTGCSATGVEYDPRIFEQARQNLKSCARACDVALVCADAREYLPQNADCFYFFNPFSAEILASVLRNIKGEWYASPRPMHLFFYYPNDDYRRILAQDPQLVLAEEIDCRDLFDGHDRRECILVYRITE
ncbi:MAG: class I SAM-dependent methyltransferase [Oscillospiraceae bacterium]|nr:class I SAM-dependent methyltransferase [Oscillospiraceae bacterium]